MSSDWSSSFLFLWLSLFEAVLSPPRIQNDAAIETSEGLVEIADQDFSQPHTSLRYSLGMKAEDGKGNREEGSVYDLEISQRSNQSKFKEIIQSYNRVEICSESLNHAKRIISSYTPGSLIYKAGGLELSDYHTPRTTSLLLIGPKGSGKSSLVNKISRVFETDCFASQRAQVTYNSSRVDGTFFLGEYMIPKNSTSLSLFDTRSLSDDSRENLQMLERWMTKGVRDGELVLRESDSPSLKARMKRKARLDGAAMIGEPRMINFVIFVVNGLSVLKSMGDDDPENSYCQTIVTSFNSPYLSFKDDKPVVVVTHGDLLSLLDRARVLVHLGELLGIPPAKQVFDIPESNDPVTQMEILGMLFHCLEHADKNIPMRRRNKIAFAYMLKWLSLILIVGVAICLHYSFFSRASSIVLESYCSRKHPTTLETVDELKIDWHSIRHLWFDV